MNKFLAAELPSGMQIFFVFDEEFDGLLVSDNIEEKISFWSYVTKRNDVEFLTETKLQKELTLFNWKDEKWLKKFCPADADFIIAVNKAISTSFN